MNRESRENRWAVAVHESAHCVAAWRLRVRVTLLTATPDGGGAMFHSYTTGFRQAVISAAGIHSWRLNLPFPEHLAPAEPLTPGCGLPPGAIASVLNRSAAADELGTDSDTVREFTHRKRARWQSRWSRVLVAMYAILFSHRLLTYRLACALYERGTIRSREIDLILGKRPPRRPAQTPVAA